MIIAKFILVTSFLMLGISCFSQEKVDSLLGKLDPQKLATSIAAKSKKIEDKLVEKSVKTLTKMQQQEEKIYKKLLQTKDSLQAKTSLDGIKEKYKGLKDKMTNPEILSKAKQYIPKLDTLSSVMKLLDQNGVAGKVKDALAKTESLQDKFQQAEEIKKFIRERKEQLKAQLEKLGMVKQLKKINKQVYYYAAQIKEYKEILKDPKKIEKKAIEMLAKTKVFQNFMKKNSILASLFGIHDDISNSSSQISLTGLQTRVQVNQIIQQQISSGGPNVQQQLQQNMQSAQAQLQNLKDRISQLGGGNDDVEMPDFKPNNQKVKSFLKRLEYGTNIQTQKATSFFPVTSDIGLSLGYKLNDKNIIGVGASYKIGMGTGWRNIRISHQGLSLRSYADVKLKASFWLSAGYEQNYMASFSDFSQLQDRNAWQQSGLLGVSKKYKMGKKFNGKMQLLWDFMSYQQLPRTQPIVFRFGFSLK